MHQVSSICKKHLFEKDWDTWEYACVYCGEISSDLIDYQNEVYKKHKKAYSNFQLFDVKHDKFKYIQISFNTMRGYHEKNKKVKIELGPKTLIVICKLIPEVFTWKDVFTAYKKTRLEEFWTSWMLETGQWNGNLPWGPLEESYLYTIIQEIPLIQVKFNWENSKRLNHFYLLKKICSIIDPERNTDCIPLKTKEKTLIEYELKWKDICLWFGWKQTFIQPKKVPYVSKFGKTKYKNEITFGYLHWEKHKIISQLQTYNYDKFYSGKVKDYDWWKKQ